MTEQITASGAHFIVWDAEGRVQSKSANWHEGIEKPANPQNGENTLMLTFRGMRQAVHFTGSGRCFIVGKPIEREMAELRQLGGYLFLAGAGVLTLGLLGGWWMITLETKLEAVICLGDAQRLGQVITNLLTNALEHTRDRILITTRRENGHAILTVSDNGPGIPAEHLPHLFERFYRAEASRTRGAEHNGHGFAISKTIVDAHGGEIVIESSSTNGAKFFVRLPMVS